MLVQKIKGLARPVSNADDLHNIATIASGSAIMVGWGGVWGGEGGAQCRCCCLCVCMCVNV